MPSKRRDKSRKEFKKIHHQKMLGYGFPRYGFWWDDFYGKFRSFKKRARTIGKKEIKCQVEEEMQEEDISESEI